MSSKARFKAYNKRTQVSILDFVKFIIYVSFAIFLFLQLRFWFFTTKHKVDINTLIQKEEDVEIDKLLNGREKPVDFWNPIEIDKGSDPMVTLCKLNFKEYNRNPHQYHMFRHFVKVSKCHGSNYRVEPMSKLINSSNLPTQCSRFIQPSGFIFHIGRVGSTLVANMLASDPFSMVYSESDATVASLSNCDSCPRAEKIKMFRDMVTLMGCSSYHKRMFIKFQTVRYHRMDIALDSYPDVPWIWIYRDPVETMMSHIFSNRNRDPGAKKVITCVRVTYKYYS